MRGRIRRHKKWLYPGLMLLFIGVSLAFMAGGMLRLPVHAIIAVAVTFFLSLFVSFRPTENQSAEKNSLKRSAFTQILVGLFFVAVIFSIWKFGPEPYYLHGLAALFYIGFIVTIEAIITLDRS